MTDPRMSLETDLHALLEPGTAAATVGEGPARAAALRVVAGFVDGARAALTCDDVPSIIKTIDPLPAVAWEGAGLVASEHDAAHDTRRFAALLTSRPDRAVLLCIGHGWSRAIHRLPAAIDPAEATPDAGWWTADGHGFFLGLLRPRHVLAASASLPEDHAVRALFDRGIGRSLWYRHAGDVRSIAHVIGRLGERAADLWCGVGIAAIFSGGLALLAPSARAELLRRGGQPLRTGAAITGLAVLSMHGHEFDAALLRDAGVDMPRVRGLLAPDPDYLRWRASLAAAL